MARNCLVFLTSLALSVYTVPSSNWISYSLSSERTYVTFDLKNKAVPGHFAMTSSPSSKAISFNLAGLCTISFGLFAGEATALAETLGAALADTLGLGADSAATVAASAALALALALLEGRPRGMLGSWQVIPYEVVKLDFSNTWRAVHFSSVTQLLPM